jgi:hypothetical protein
MSVETGETEEPMTASHVYLSVRKRHSRWAPHGTAKTPGQVEPAPEPAQARVVQLEFVKRTAWLLLPLFFKELDKIFMLMSHDQ